MVKDPVPLDKVNRVLVVKLRHHGDVLLSSPVFSVLKAHAPHIEIDALVYSDTAEMLTLHPKIHKLHSINRLWKKQGLFAQAHAEFELLRTLRERRYELIIHLTEHPRGAWLARLTGARWAVAPQTKGRGKWWLNSFTHFYSLPRNGGRHAVELNLDALRRIGLYPAENERQLHLISGATADDRVAKLLRENDVTPGCFIHIHPTSRWPFKCWPAERMAQLIDQLESDGWRVVITAAPDSNERLMINCILAACKSRPVNLCGQLSLKEIAALTAQAKLFIGVDSAPMQIAAAMGTPLVALFGPSGETDWGPWQAKARVVTSNRHSCRPCGQDGCGGGKTSDCLEQLDVSQVIAAAQALLPLKAQAIKCRSN
jgi:heptosyltransferase-3